MKLYQQLASLVQTRLNCIESKNDEWFDKHEERIEALVKNHMPSGSGFDSGTALDLGASDPDRLVFRTSFHHMDGYGMYDGWTEHDIIVTGSLAFGFSLRITGRDRDQIKDYITDCFSTALNTDIALDDGRLGLDTPERKEQEKVFGEGKEPEEVFLKPQAD